MSNNKVLKDDTLSLHSGQTIDSTHGARAQPIYFTTSYSFKNSEHAASLFNMERGGHVYSRISNPTNAVLEERIASLEGGVGSVSTASGQAALHLAIATLMNNKSHILASNSLYGGSHNLLEYTLPRFGINTTFVDFRDTKEFIKNIRSNTRLIFSEVLGNPGLDVINLPEIASISAKKKIPILIDSTFTTPYLFKPFLYGANIIMHSATKFLGGHGVAVGGILVDGGNFDWENSNKFPNLTKPYKGFHNMVFSDESTTSSFIMRARREGLRDFGACLSPMNAFQILQGIETLNLRMEKHIKNTRKIVDFLTTRREVKRVIYPELTDHKDYDLAKKLLPKGCGAVFSFEIKGGIQAGKKFIEALDIFSHLANVGDAKSLVIHPASTTHFRMSKQALRKAGITEGTIRLSIGLEDPDDLISDLKVGLKKSII